MPVSIATLDWQTVQIADSAISSLGVSIEGKILDSSSVDYDEVREIWNAMIDRRPALIVQCSSTSDVSKTIQFARDNNLLFTVRGVGHNIAGNSLCDDALLIDLSQMKGITVDAEHRIAHVQPGVSLGELDAATQAHALATPVGINSTTGVAGLTLGGGFGWLSRKHGLTIDSLISATVVTESGDIITASSEENEDLFWGLRGGGGNFGIVTSFEFALHPVGPEVLSGLIVHPFSDAEAVLKYYREFCKTAPDELTVWIVMRKAPPLPFLPEEVHGTEVVVVAALYAGDQADGLEALKELRAFGNPIADVISPHVYAEFQQAFDPLLTPGLRNYWKSHDLDAITDDVVDVLLEYVATLPSGHCEIFIAQMGGATSRVPADATAYYHRDANFIMNVHGRWEDEREDDKGISWCRDLFDAMAPHSTGGVYVNFMTEEEGDRVSTAYGPAYERLVDLKKKYDPSNIFRFNQNILPD